MKTFTSDELKQYSSMTISEFLKLQKPENRLERLKPFFNKYYKIESIDSEVKFSEYVFLDEKILKETPENKLWLDKLQTFNIYRYPLNTSVGIGNLTTDRIRLVDDLENGRNWVEITKEEFEEAREYFNRINNIADEFYAKK